MRLLKLSIKQLILMVVSFLMFFPFLWMLLSALKTKDEIFKVPLQLFPHSPQWQTFANAFQSAPFGVYIWNSTYTSIAIVLLQTITSALFAYALTQMKWKGKQTLFSIVMGTYMLPAAATYVPSYIILSKLGLIDSHIGLIISSAASVYGVFLFRQAFLQVSKEVVQAALIDGASHLKILFKVIFPLTKPTFITFMLISFVQNYNSYLWPSLILQSQDKMLITNGLRQFFIEGGAYGVKWPEVMAASTFTILPLLLLFFAIQKVFVSGISDNGIK
ncbi:carbohydrate ABC transporter permease [Macrococcoides canis]|nr:carbohydrate ABC transporter permease [Macrococcus canis]UTH02922.1 carbohydrate ABC transporter permease [Macrococcus canis]